MRFGAELWSFGFGKENSQHRVIGDDPIFVFAFLAIDCDESPIDLRRSCLGDEKSFGIVVFPDQPRGLAGRGRARFDDARKGFEGNQNRVIDREQQHLHGQQQSEERLREARLTLLCDAPASGEE